ncbi:MAG: hypothetical protein ACJ76F_11910 [Bacteroidia bacterium]
MNNSIKTKVSIILVLFVTGFTVSNCKKGDTGPEGPAGSVNITSKTFTVKTWASNSSFYYASLSIAELTSDVNSKGVVQVFLSTNSGTNWVAMPYTAVASTNYFMNYITGVGLVEPHWVYNGVGVGSDPNSFYSATCQVKVVIIPPSMKKRNVDYKNYEELRTVYGIKN